MPPASRRPVVTVSAKASPSSRTSTRHDGGRLPGTLATAPRQSTASTRAPRRRLTVQGKRDGDPRLARRRTRPCRATSSPAPPASRRAGRSSPDTVNGKHDVPVVAVVDQLAEGDPLRQPATRTRRARGRRSGSTAPSAARRSPRGSASRGASRARGRTAARVCVPAGRRRRGATAISSTVTCGALTFRGGAGVCAPAAGRGQQHDGSDCTCEGRPETHDSSPVCPPV